MTNGWLQVAQEALKVPGLLIEIYGDLAKPGVQQVGKALGTIIGLGNTVLWPIHWANEHSRLYLERNLQDYRAKLEHIPLEKIVPVAPEIGVPISEKLTYVRDIKLADMYITLLAKASSVDTISEAHPSFVNVINNLSPDEALLLEIFVTQNDLEFVTAQWKFQTVYEIAGDLLIEHELLKGLVFPQNAAAYLSNLEGLGLVTIDRNHSVYKSTDANPEIEALSPVYQELQSYWSQMYPASAAPKPNRTLKFEYGVIYLTEYGRQFISACHGK